MNKKIDALEIMANTVGLSIALFPGMTASMILNISKNASVFSVILSLY